VDSSERACKEALACLARNRKLVDFDFGRLETKNDGWREELIFGWPYGGCFRRPGDAASVKLQCPADGTCLDGEASGENRFLLNDFLLCLLGKIVEGGEAGVAKVESVLSEKESLSRRISDRMDSLVSTSSYFPFRSSISFRIRTSNFETNGDIDWIASSCSRVVS